MLLKKYFWVLQNLRHDNLPTKHYGKIMWGFESSLLIVTIFTAPMAEWKDSGPYSQSVSRSTDLDQSAFWLHVDQGLIWTKEDWS